MAKYAFNHDTNQLTVAFGISEERFEEIVKGIQHAKIDADNVLETFENALNKLDPKNMVEAAFIGFSIAKIYEVESSPLARFLMAMKNNEL